MGIAQQITKEQKAPSPEARTGAMLSVESVRAGYDAGPDVLTDITLTARPGEVTALLGPNGCGKSTLLKTMSRLLTPRAGRVRVGEAEIHRLSPRRAAHTVAYLPQQPVAPEGLTVGELVARGRHPHRAWWRGAWAADIAAVDAALAETGTAALADRDLAALSGGQRQRVWLAMVLAQDCPVLLLDEPTTYLDPAHAVETLELVRALARGGRTVVTVLHDLMLAGAYADRIVLLGAGRILADGDPHAALTPATLAEAYRLRADVLDDPAGVAPIIVPRGTC